MAALQAILSSSEKFDEKQNNKPNPDTHHHGFDDGCIPEAGSTPSR